MKLIEIYNVCVPESKRKTDKMIPWVYYVMRPLSILVTKPLLKTSITPVNVTFGSYINRICVNRIWPRHADKIVGLLGIHCLGTIGLYRWEYSPL